MIFAFSEISPWREYFSFVAVVMFGVGFCCIPHIRRHVPVLIDRFLDFSRKRGAISELSLEADLRRIDLVRMTVGLFGCLRYGAIYLSAIDGGGQAQLVWAAVATVLSLLIMVGLFTPLAVFLLMGGPTSWRTISWARPHWARWCSRSSCCCACWHPQGERYLSIVG